MGNRKVMFLMVCVLVVSMLAGCSGPDLGSLAGDQAGSGSVERLGTDGMAAAESDLADDGAGITVAGDDAVVASSGADDGAGAAATAGAGADSVAKALEENDGYHAVVEENVWDSSGSTRITLKGNTITVDGEGVMVEGTTATISAAGTYSLVGSLAEGQIVVDTEDEGIVRLVLDGVELRSTTSAPIYVVRAQETVIGLADGSENYVADATSYVQENAEEDEPNAAIFSKGDLTIAGNGTLTVEGSHNDGIASKDGLVIAGGTITVRAVDDGIRGKDYLVIQDGTITVDAGGDGLKADNEQDATKGYILVEGGTLDVTSGGDALAAQTDVLITEGEFKLSSGGGSNGRVDTGTSAKGIKAGVNVSIDGGNLLVDAADDAIHSNGSLTINGGTFVLASGDDALHADATLEVNGGRITITDSYEGIESALITINDGQIHITSSDDGINVAGGTDGSGTDWQPGMGGGVARGGRPGPGAGPGQDAFAYAGDYHLYVNGGYIVIDAGGDGLDSNGSIEMNSGVVLVNGPTERMNGALDYITSFQITGGFLVAAGSAGMAEAPSESSTQVSVLLNLDTIARGGTLVHIRSEEGDEILTFAPTKDYQSIVVSSSQLSNGTTYDLYFGGSSTGTCADGLYQGGSYSSGTQYASFTLIGMVTRLGGYFR